MMMCPRKSMVDTDYRTGKLFDSDRMFQGIEKEFGGWGSGVILGPFASQFSVIIEYVGDVDEDK